MLSAALVLPSPAFALRQTNAGLEESPVHRQLEANLRGPAAGLEELPQPTRAGDRGQAEALAVLQGGFPRFELSTLEFLNTRTQQYVADEIGGLFIQPLTGRMATSMLWRHPAAAASRVLAARLPLLRATLYARAGASADDSLWFDTRYVPVIGDQLYHADGTPLSDEELAAAGLRRLLDRDGRPVQIALLATGGRVFAVPGPWVVPYIDDGEGIRPITTLSELRALTGQEIPREQVADLLQHLAAQGVIKLRLAATLEFKGIGTWDLTLLPNAPKALRPFEGKAVYMPGVDFREVTGSPGRYRIGLGAIGRQEAEAVQNDRQLRRHGAVLLADTVWAAPLFTPETLPELAKTPWRETWVSVRLSINTDRWPVFAEYRTISDEYRSFHALPALAAAYYRELFGDDAGTAMAPHYLLNTLAKNVRAWYLTRRFRHPGSEVPYNYGPLGELIDTGSEEVHSMEERHISAFFHEWELRPLTYTLETLAGLRAAATPFTPAAIVGEWSAFRDAYVRSLLHGASDSRVDAAFQRAFQETHPLAFRSDLGRATRDALEKIEATAEPPAGLEETVAFSHGMITPSRQWAPEAFVAARLVNAAQRRAVVPLAPQIPEGLRVFVHPDVTLPALAGVEVIRLPREPTAAQAVLTEYDARSSEPILLPMTIAPGTEHQWRRDGVASPIVVLPASGLEELTPQRLAALVTIAQRVGGILRVGLEEWVQATVDDVEHLSVQY